MPVLSPNQKLILSGGDNVTHFRRKVLELAAREEEDSSVVVMAVADVVAYAAAALDREGVPLPLEQRLQTFCDRVAETYERVRVAQ